ncbi:MAG: helix-turn-helix domain-containing protein [Enterobacter asburiae]|jgi:AraC family transcriptional activator of mar-sox-rob regulon/AraC family mar-sox-rob regulon transcriptional activator|nr:helix-turn-helix domain-containing protein [Enterobacter asburiae]
MQFESGHHQEIISEIIRWINLHPATILDTTSVARRAGFSRWHMQRLFKQHTGMTLGRYIKIVRLGYATIDLMKTKSPVIDIAVQYGYESQQTFTRAIKCHTGLNPGAIKRMTQGDKEKFAQKIEQLIASVSL